jgi:hypothetical protein
MPLRVLEGFWQRYLTFMETGGAQAENPDTPNANLVL